MLRKAIFIRHNYGEKKLMLDIAIAGLARFIFNENLCLCYEMHQLVRFATIFLLYVVKLVFTISRNENYDHGRC